MIQEFQCLSCGRKFEAAGSNAVCPYCQSDNVRPAKPSYLKYLLWVLIFIVSLIVGFLVSKFAFQAGDDNPQPLPPAPAEVVVPTETQKPGDAPAPSVAEDLVEPIKLGEMTPVYDKATKTYSLKVNVKEAPEGAELTYSLFETAVTEETIVDMKPIKTSEDGQFTGIAPKAKGDDVASYFVVVGGKVKGKMLGIATQEVTGFRFVETVREKMEQSELQRRINSQDNSLAADARISHSVRLQCSGLQEGDMQPQTFSDIFTNFSMHFWSSVTVTNVTYDAENRITIINMRVNY